MFVEAKANKNGEEIVVLWNCLLITVVGGMLLLVLLYYPVLFAFPLMFRRLAWIDLAEVGKVLLAYSLYQVFYCALVAKNGFLFAQGRPVSVQTGVFCGWLVSLFLLWRIYPVQNLSQIPCCLVAGTAVALLLPNLGRGAFFYRKGLLKRHTSSLVSRALPVTAGSSVVWIEPVFDGVIASFLKEGSLTIYYFFGRLMLYTATAISSGYIQPLTKHLAELAGSSYWRELRRQTRNVALTAALLGLGILAIGMFVLNYLDPAKISLLRPNARLFGQDLPVLFLLLGFLFGLLSCAVYSNSLFILRRERLYLLASIVTFAVGVFLKISGARLFGLRGLAAGTSSYWIIYAVVLAFGFSRALKQREAVAPATTYAPAYQESGGEAMK
jgi:peptidoglycan biosynthesis protein MviN/MurJ (putative lipid II flippase)